MALPAGRASAQVYCGPADVAFVVDDTFSTGPVLDSLKAALPAIHNQIAASTDPGTGAGPDYRIALVTFKDQVTVRLGFGSNTAIDQANANEFAQRIASLVPIGGGPGSGNASDEALNTVIMSLAEADRLPGQQAGDFTSSFREDFNGLTSRRIIILLTGFQPGGFDDDFRAVDLVNAHQRALDAAAASIRIVAIFTPAIEAQQGAAAIMLDYAATTGGIYVRTDEPPMAPGAAILNALGSCPAVNKPPAALCGSAFEAAAPPQCDGVPASIDNGSFDPEDSLNVSLEQLPPAPYAVGATDVTLTVTDSQGASASCQATVTVLCTPPDTTPPTVSLATPPAPVTGIVTLSATATDGSGVMQVEFFAGATSLGVDVMDPYSVAWNTSALASGTIVTLRAVATDTAHLTAESTVTVTIDHPVPSVTVSAAPVWPGARVVATIANGPGNRTDWVALFAAGGSSCLDWKYLNGSQAAPEVGVTGAAVSFTLPLTVGTYTMRFYAGMTILATSGPITVAIPGNISVAVSATAVVAGGTVTVTVTNGPGNRTDWVGLFAEESTTWSDWKYLNGSQSPPLTGLTDASMAFTLPATAGTYTVRFYAGTILLATSPAVTVTPLPSATLTATPATVFPGGSVTATVGDGPGNRTDWVAVYAAGASTYFDWRYLNGSQIAPAAGLTAATVALTMPTTTGTYTVRLYAGTRLLATSGPVTVGFSSDISLAITPANVVARGTVTATVANGPGNRTDWIALFATGGPSYLDWKYLNGSQTAPAAGVTGAAVAFPMPATPGTYTLRFYTGTVLLATSESITVIPPPSATLTATPATVLPGGSATATVADGPGNRRDWIGVYAAGSSTYMDYLDWKYLNGSKAAPASGLTSAAVVFAMPSSPGTYVLKFYAGTTLLAASDAVVVQ